MVVGEVVGLGMAVKPLALRAERDFSNLDFTESGRAASVEDLTASAQVEGRGRGAMGRLGRFGVGIVRGIVVFPDDGLGGRLVGAF